MTELKKGKSYVNVTGKLKLGANSFSGEKISAESGYKYVQINLGVETAEGNVIYGGMMGGYSPKNPVIYAMNKEDNSQLEVNFADRLNEAIVNTVADFKLHKVGLERNENGELQIEKFLSPMDVHDLLKEKLVDGMDITLRGSFEFSEYRDETQRKFIIQNIFLPYQQKEKDAEGKFTENLLPVEYGATFTQTILLNEDSFKKITKEDAKAGEVVIPAQALEYVSKRNGKVIKKTLPFGLAVVVKIDKENPEKTAKILDGLFKVKKGKIREITIEGDIIEGYEQQEATSVDIELSDEIKELIAMGLYSENEAKQKMTVRGTKVSKLVFTRPFIQKDDSGTLKIDINDDKYEPKDMFVDISESAPAKKETASEEAVEQPVDDESWMKALGV